MHKKLSTDCRNTLLSVPNFCLISNFECKIATEKNRVQSQRADRLDNQTVICPLSAHTERADHLWTGCPKRCCRSCFQRAVYLGSPLPNTSLGLHPKTFMQIIMLILS